jgi:hypothetical protein
VDIRVYVVRAAGVKYPTSTKRVLYCCALFKPGVELAPKRSCLDSVAALSFYSTRQGSYKKTRGLTCGPKVVGTLLQHLGY